jgi:hypothetical protein
MPEQLTDQQRESRLRRMAEREGLALSKSRRRDPQAIDYGGWMVVEPFMNAVVGGASPTRKAGAWTTSRST